MINEKKKKAPGRPPAQRPQTKRPPAKQAAAKRPVAKKPAPQRVPARPQSRPKPVPKPQNTAPEVVYTPPAPINRKKLLIRLATAAAVALALFLGCTIFFRVKDVVVTGTRQYTDWTVREASGIEEGASLLTFGKTRAAGKIMEQLRYVKSVRVGISLPDTVNIHVEELEVTYSIQDTQDRWWLISCDGRVVEQTNETKARETTVLKGLRLENPVVGQTAVAAGGAADDLVTDRERLEAALSVATQLESCEILGKAASVDLTDLTGIQLWYGDDYQVLLGSPDRMDEKILMMYRVIEQHRQEGGYQSGVLDITLTQNPSSVGYTPFG